MHFVRFVRTTVLATAAGFLWVASAQAYSTGAITAFFPVAATGCNNAVCHSGGTTPTVLLSGPTSVAPNSTNTYTFTVHNPPSQLWAGLNISAADGVLAVGGPLSMNTQTILNGALAELTHTTPSPAVAGSTSFTFDWTAPASFTNVTLNGWGNAVDLSHTSLGDAAANTSLLISNSTLPPPLCPAAPGTCTTPLGSLLTLSDIPGKQRVSFTWKKGPTTNIADFGSPTSTARYGLCLYADSALVAESDVPSVTGWSVKPTGFAYKDKTSTTLQAIRLAVGTLPGKAKITAAGKGAAIGLPASLPFQGATTVTIQVVNSDNANCWGDAYTAPNIRTNTFTKFTAKH